MHKAQVQVYQDHSIKPDTLKIIDKNVGNILEFIDTGVNFLNRSPIAQALISRIDKRDLIKLENFCKAKGIVSKTNRPTTDWEFFCTNPTSNKELRFKAYKYLKKLITKQTNNPIKNWGIEVNREFSTEES